MSAIPAAYVEDLVEDLLRVVRTPGGKPCVDVVDLQQCGRATSAVTSEPCVLPPDDSDEWARTQLVAGDEPDATSGTELSSEIRACLAEAPTVMIRNIACSFDKTHISAILGEAGLAKSYFFIHVPVSQKRVKKSNMGYAFVCFKSHAFAERCQQLFSGKVFGQSSTTKICEVSSAHHPHRIPCFARKKMYRLLRQELMDGEQEWISL